MESGGILCFGFVGGHAKRDEGTDGHWGAGEGGGKTRTKKGLEHIRGEHVDNGTEATMDDIFGECGVGNPGYEK